MTVLNDTNRQKIARECACGIPHAEIAASYRISVAMVLQVDRSERNRGRRREAEPLPGPRIPDWKTARPAEERLRTGDTCRAPDCGGSIARGSYCAGHAALFYKARAA